MFDLDGYEINRCSDVFIVNSVEILDLEKVRVDTKIKSFACRYNTIPGMSCKCMYKHLFQCQSSSKSHNLF